MWYIAHYGVGHLNGGHSGRYEWGSGNRPYQGYEDSKGNLTKEGKKKFKEYLNYSKVKRYSQEYLDNYSKNYGLVRKGKDYVIKKGSTIQRITDNENESMDKRKYATITKFDNSMYKTDPYLKTIGMKNPENARADEYLATKDMKVASYDTVMKKLMDAYGNQKLSDFYKSDNQTEMQKNYYDKYIKKYEDKTVKEMYISNYDYDWSMYVGPYQARARSEDDLSLEKRYILGRGIAMDLTKKLKDTELDSYFIKKGYDAMIDAEDKASGSAMAPLIILDPKNSMYRNSSKKVKE